jgi:hypothetical protein
MNRFVSNAISLISVGNLDVTIQIAPCGTVKEIKCVSLDQF